jgi:hypothetical protein
VAANECSGGNSVTQTLDWLWTLPRSFAETHSLCTPTSVCDIRMGGTLARNEQTKNAHRILIGKT